MLAISKGKQKKILKKNQPWHARHFICGTWEKNKKKYLNIHARQMKLRTHRESLRKPASLQRRVEKM
jgi:hypothetical protein